MHELCRSGKVIRQPLGVDFLTLPWDPRIKLRSSDFQDTCFYLVSHPAGSYFYLFKIMSWVEARGFLKVSLVYIDSCRPVRAAQ